MTQQATPARETVVYSTERAVGWQEKEGRQIMGVTSSEAEGTHNSCSHQFRSESTEPMERVWKVLLKGGKCTRYAYV